MSPPAWPAPTLHRADYLFRLPRELRDKIYADALDVDCPVGLTEDMLPHIPPILRRDPNLLPEALEALTKVKTFSLNWVDPQPHAIETPHIYVDQREVRHLSITCSEFAFVYDESELRSLDDYEEVYRRTPSRLEWAKLLDFPRLQNLAIYMQKTHEGSLNTFDFGPILYSLRSRHRQINITFSLSFDKIIKKTWDDPMWGNSTHPNESSYSPMGYADMSDLCAPPTQWHLDYVQAHLSHYINTGKMPDNRRIVAGLLDQSPAGRRSLARHYAVKEPALLRCLMRDHFEVYSKRQESALQEESA